LKDIGKLSRRDLFVAGASIYWSEGSTSQSNEEVSFVNSDPKMVLLMRRWFQEICGVDNPRFIIQVRVNKLHRKRVGEIERFWSRLSGIPASQFSKTILIQSKVKKIYSDNNYYGTIRLKVRTAVQLRRKINGWIEGLALGK